MEESKLSGWKIPSRNLSESLKKELDRKRAHRTISFGETFICPKDFPKEIIAVDCPLPGALKCCPVCGKELGKSTKTETDDLHWER